MIKRSPRIRINGRQEGPGSRYDFGEPGYIDNLRRKEQPSKPSLFLPRTGKRICHGCRSHKAVKGGNGKTGAQWRCADCKLQDGASFVRINLTEKQIRQLLPFYDRVQAAAIAGNPGMLVAQIRYLPREGMSGQWWMEPGFLDHDHAKLITEKGQSVSAEQHREPHK